MRLASVLRVCSSAPAGGRDFFAAFDPRLGTQGLSSPHAPEWSGHTKEMQMNTTKNTKPTHRLYVVKGDGKEAHWMVVGAAWPNQDGKGFGLALEAIPLGGRIVMREIEAGE